MLDKFWILLLFPLFGAAFNGILGKKLPARLIGIIGSLTVLASFGVAVLSFVQLLGMSPAERAVTNHLFTWIQAGGFVAECSFLFDPLSAVMI
ncbi:MAG: NADH-quinone oxidoreductase subunit L, partial [Acidobacteriota bacterium]